MKVTKKDPHNLYGRFWILNKWYGWRMFLLRLIHPYAKLLDAVVGILSLGWLETDFAVSVSGMRLQAMFSEYKQRKDKCFSDLAETADYERDERLHNIDLDQVHRNAEELTKTFLEGGDRTCQ